MTDGALWLQHAIPQRRFGVKGPRAAELLQHLGLRVPRQPNSWTALRDHDRDDSLNVIARLGNTEFFIEEQGDAPGINALEQSLAAEMPGAYPVLREDLGLVIGGPRAPGLLAEVCNVNFGSLALEHKPVVMTLLAGVTVLVLPQVVGQPSDAAITYRIWCDPSFGPYLWETLAGISRTSVVNKNGRAA